MDLAGGAERGEQLDLGRRKLRVPEEADASGNGELHTALAQFVDNSGVTRRWRLGGSGPAGGLGEDAPPELRLPGQVGVDGPAAPITRAAALPVGEHARALPRVRGEKSSKTSCHGIPARLPSLAEPLELGMARPGAAAEVPSQRVEAWRAHAFIDRSERRPCETVRDPRVIAIASEKHAHQ